MDIARHLAWKCNVSGRNLEDESSQAEKASQASAGHGDGLAGTRGGQSAVGGRRRRGVLGPAASGGQGSASRGSAGVADDGRDDRDGLGDGAGAVGDGEGGGLSDGVGRAAMGDLGGLGAVGGDGRDDLSGVGHIAPGVGASDGSKDGSSRELHFDGLFFGVEYMLEKEYVR